MGFPNPTQPVTVLRVLPTRRPRSDRGLTLAAFSLAFMLLMVLLLGVVDAGVNFGNRSEIGHAALTTAHLVATGGTTGDRIECAIYGRVPDAAAALLCFAKEATHMDASRVRIKIMPTKRAAVVCVMAQAYSATGMFAFVTHGRSFTARSVVATRRNIPDIAETPLPSTDWNFCSSGV